MSDADADSPREVKLASPLPLFRLLADNKKTTVLVECPGKAEFTKVLESDAGFRVVTTLQKLVKVMRSFDLGDAATCVGPDESVIRWALLIDTDIDE